MAVAETHHRADVPNARFTFEGFKSWHADRGGSNKVHGSYSLCLYVS